MKAKPCPRCGNQYYSRLKNTYNRHVVIRCKECKHCFMIENGKLYEIEYEFTQKKGNVKR